MTSKPPGGVLVVGTDTAVGKTVVAAGLAWALRRRGIDVGVMKPVETGVSTRRRSDAALLPLAARAPPPYPHPPPPAAADRDRQPPGRDQPHAPAPPRRRMPRADGARPDPQPSTTLAGTRRTHEPGCARQVAPSSAVGERAVSRNDWKRLGTSGTTPVARWARDQPVR